MPWDDGDDDAFLVGVAMSIGEVVGIVKRSMSLLRYCGVRGWGESVEDESESSASTTIESTGLVDEWFPLPQAPIWGSQSSRGIF